MPSRRTAIGPVRKDSISTNMLATPSQLSDDVDGDSLETHGSQHDPHDIASAATSICACKEDDYLVLWRTTSGSPVSLWAEITQLEQAKATLPSTQTKAEASSRTTIPLISRKRRCTHFRDELLPAAESSPSTFPEPQTRKVK